MRPAISIIIPSLGQIQFLTPLFESLRIQTIQEPVEIFLCVTGAGPELAASLPSLPAGMSVRFLDSPSPGISQARNVGLDHAAGELVLFLDDDCYLPRADYLQSLVDFHRQNPDCGGGGAYLTVKENRNFASAFYNYMCNAWLESHVNSRSEAEVLLGGCCFYPRSAIGETRFPVSKPRAGEEMDFNNEILGRGHRLLFHREWSVVHDPGYGLDDVFERAWKHGLQLDAENVMPSQQRWNRFWRRSQKKPANFVRFLPMTLAYGAWGRAAFAAKKLRRTK
jgi:glycosyltransferase involved in cell wall biosynthesis